MLTLANSCNEGRLAIAGEFTVSCRVLNLVPVDALRTIVRRKYLCAGLIIGHPRSNFPTVESQRS